MHAGLTCVVLAAGRSTRFPGNKLLHPLPGGTLLERAIRACGDFPCVAVCSPQVRSRARELGAETVLNEHPERGMAYSLQLANERIGIEQRIAVLPADLAYIEAEHLARIAAALRADVVYPVRADGTPGHPVIFSPRARARIAGLESGAAIRALRDDPQLSRRTIPVEEAWPFRDVDDESDLAAL